MTTISSNAPRAAAPPPALKELTPAQATEALALLATVAEAPADGFDNAASLPRGGNLTLPSPGAAPAGVSTEHVAAALRGAGGPVPAELLKGAPAWDGKSFPPVPGDAGAASRQRFEQRLAAFLEASGALSALSGYLSSQGAVSLHRHAGLTTSR